MQGAEDELGTIRRRPLGAVQHQVVVIRLMRINVEVRAEKPTSLPFDLVELPGGGFAIDLETSAEGCNTVLTIADQKDTQGRVSR